MCIYFYRITVETTLVSPKMKAIENQFKRILIKAMLLFCATGAAAQVTHQRVYAQLKKKPAAAHVQPKKTVQVSDQYKDFMQLAARAGVTFNFPKGFSEISAMNNEDFSYDYAMEIPDKDFEVWFQVKSQKENYASYEAAKDDNTRQVANPDSLYIETGKAQATALAGDPNFFVRTIPPKVLARYNADAGRSYLLNLVDMPSTKHYKYALLLTLQRNHTGTILVVCFTNEKDPEFFKNIDKASNCLKFKP